MSTNKSLSKTNQRLSMSKSYQQSSDRYKLAVGCNIFCIIKLQQLIRKQLIRGKLFYKLELNIDKLSRVNICLNLILGRIVWFDLSGHTTSLDFGIQTCRHNSENKDPRRNVTATSVLLTIVTHSELLYVVKIHIFT